MNYRYLSGSFQIQFMKHLGEQKNGFTDEDIETYNKNAMLFWNKESSTPNAIVGVMGHPSMKGTVVNGNPYGRQTIVVPIFGEETTQLTGVRDEYILHQAAKIGGTISSGFLRRDRTPQLVIATVADAREGIEVIQGISAALKDREVALSHVKRPFSEFNVPTLAVE